MARMRTLKPETFSSETLSLAPVAARWTFAGLWTYADDAGRGKADPRLIKAAIWPLDDDVSAADVAEHLDILEKLDLLCRYEHQGRQYLHIVNFAEHQRPNRPVPSKLPECPKDAHGALGALPGGIHGVLSAGSVSPHGDGSQTSFTNTPSTPPTCSGEGEGVVDGDGDSFSSEDEERSSDADEVREDVERLCTHLADRIEGNGSLRPNIGKKWRDAARLMIDRDKRTEEQIHRAIDWCQDNEFWRTNVMSMPKLREQYDVLRMQAESQRGRASPNGRHAPGTGSDVPARTSYRKENVV